jgi:Luciferase-like monooxygenase
MISFSVLDLAAIVQAATAAQSFRKTLDVAQQAERCGYHRFWLGEHRNTPGIASAFAFASHFAPAQLVPWKREALHNSRAGHPGSRGLADAPIQRRRFQPSTQVFDQAERLWSYETTGQLRATL